MKKIASVLTLAAFSLAAFSAPASAAPKERSFVLTATGNSLPANLENQVRAAGGQVTRTLPEIGVAFARSSNTSFAVNAEKIGGLRSAVPDIKLQWIDPKLDKVRVDADYGNPPNSGDDDKYFDLQWGHDAIDAPEAWETGAFGAGVRVAVLDSGIDASHPDLAPNLNTSLSTSFVPGEGYDVAPTVASSHGTHVAGTIAAADNGLGTIGVAPKAEIVAVKVLSEVTGSGAFEGVAAGMVYAANIDADVINMSLGAYLPGHNFCDDDGCYTGRDIAELVNMMKRASSYAYQQGTTIIASAGNDAIDRDHDADGVVLPADLPNVITISATGPLSWALNPDMSDAQLSQPAYYTNYGQSRINMAAPGGNVDFSLRQGPAASWPTCTVAGLTRPCWAFDLVFSTDNNGYSWKAGTSMAAPHASGVAALIIGEHGGSMSPAQVEAKMRQSAEDLGKPGKDDYYGNGQVNAYNAVR